jgi:hypothetical protein
VKVVDEDRQSMINTEVEVWYHVGNKQLANKGLSSTKGEFVSTGEGLLPQVTIYARSQGCYDSSVIYKFDKKLIFNRWEPWNPTIEVVLKKKRNPVPMIMGGPDWVAIPKLDTPVGYDLEKGDWVAPYGTGIINDLTIEFNLSSRAYTDYDANMTISFPNGQDGIQEYWFDKAEQSAYKWPFEAPLSGYKRSVNVFERDTPENGYKTNKKEGVNYIFRIRTKLDKDGNVISANYGKFTGEFGISRKGKTRFSYILNPDGTRNLEEDPKKNLFNKK